MSYKKLNAHTWVIDDGKNTVQKHLEKTLVKSTNFLKEKKNRNPAEQKKLYEKFVNDIFKERTFICQKEFHTEIRKKFNSNISFFRRRMIQLELITVKNGLITPFLK